MSVWLDNVTEIPGILKIADLVKSLPLCGFAFYWSSVHQHGTHGHIKNDDDDDDDNEDGVIRK